jgi:hypothetical protein
MQNVINEHPNALGLFAFIDIDAFSRSTIPMAMSGG